MPDSSIIGVVVGGAISLVSSLGATVFIDHAKQAREARSLAIAFRGGIGAILTIVYERHYVSIVEQLIQRAEQGIAITPLHVKARRNYIELYSKNVDKIGILHPALTSRIPTFYTCVSSLLEDIDNMDAGGWDGMSQADLLTAFKEFHSLLTRTLSLGEQIQSLVDQKYPDSFLWACFPG